jgi:DNA-binding MarR family transcriptional regulator
MDLYGCQRQRSEKMNITEQFLQQTIIFSLLVVEKVNKQLEKTYKNDLTFSEFYTLLTVSYNGDMTMTAFADNLGIQKQQATRVINTLVQKGYIQRVYDEADRRVVLIRLTPEARAYLKEYTSKTIEKIRESLADFTESEFQELQAAMETMNRMLAKMTISK